MSKAINININGIDEDTIFMQQKIKLYRFNDTDIDQLINWIPTADFLMQWGGPDFSFPLDQSQLEDHINKSKLPDPDRHIFKAIHKQTGKTIGHGELVSINRLNQTAKIARVLIGPEKYRGMGFGKRIVKELLMVGFKKLKLKKIDLNVFDFNHAAIHCYEKVGFKKEKFLANVRQYKHDYLNIWVMSIHKNMR